MSEKRLEEGCLLIYTLRKLFAFVVCNLVSTEGVSETDKDCNPATLEPIFDFTCDVQFSNEVEDPITPSSHVFVFRSEIYVFRGGLRLHRYENQTVDICKIYKVDLHNHSIIEPGFHPIPPLPTPFAPCFLGNLGADVYCLVYQQVNGFWVLRSSSSSLEWQSLSSPPYPSDLIDDNWVCTEHLCDFHCIVINDNKLLFQFKPIEGQASHVYSFDPTVGKWESGEHFWSSLRLKPDQDYHFLPCTSMSIPGHDGIIVLHYDVHDYGQRMAIHAMLMGDDNVVSRYQLLVPFTRKILSTKSTVVSQFVTDLGNGMACAMVYLFRRAYKILCMSIFMLTPAAEAEHPLCGVDAAEAPPNVDVAEAPPNAIETKMFDICVLRERIFDVDHFQFDDLCYLRPFVFRR